MQPWKISVGFTVIILAVAAMVAGERFAYLQPHLQIIAADYWMPVAWYGGLAVVTLLAVIYAAARAAKQLFFCNLTESDLRSDSPVV